MLAVVLLGLLQRIVPIVFVELGFEADWLYRPASGLTFLGATVIFAIAVVADVLWNRDGGRTRDRVRATVDEALAAGLGLFVAILAVRRSCRYCSAPSSPRCSDR